jgi:hypothetical protein
MTPAATLDQARRTYRETGSTGRLAPPSLSDRPGFAGAWLGELQEQLQELLRLPEGWDSYSAEPISRQAASETLRFLSVAPVISPAPALVPVNDGSLQLEWHRQQIDLEIRFCADGRIEALFEDLQTGDEWEREGWSALVDIQKTLYRLAGHEKG